MNKAIDAIIIGAMKSGTTSIWHMLKTHPEINPCNVKEPAFFSNHADWKNKLDQYHALWDWDRKGIKIEASTGYTIAGAMKKGIVQRLHNYNQNLKLIYVIRHPLDRAISNYIHVFRLGKTKMTIDQALTASIDDNRILKNSSYHSIITSYLQLFNPDQLLILNFEKIIKEPFAVYKELCQFLGCDPIETKQTFNMVRKNTTNQKPLQKRWFRTLHPKWKKNLLGCLLPRSATHHTKYMIDVKPVPNKETQEWFMAQVSPDIEQLELLTGWNLESWKSAR